MEGKEEVTFGVCAHKKKGEREGPTAGDEGVG